MRNLQQLPARPQDLPRMHDLLGGPVENQVRTVFFCVIYMFGEVEFEVRLILHYFLMMGGVPGGCVKHYKKKK